MAGVAFCSLSLTMILADTADLDVYERKKLAIMMFEKFNGFVMCFMFVLLVVYSGLLLVSFFHDLYVVLAAQSGTAGRVILQDAFALAVLLATWLVLYVGLYFSRASAQSRPRFIRWVRIA